MSSKRTVTHRRGRILGAVRRAEGWVDVESIANAPFNFRGGRTRYWGAQCIARDLEAMRQQGLTERCPASGRWRVNPLSALRARREKKTTQQSLASLYGWPLVRRWAGAAETVACPRRAKHTEVHDWERVSFGGKSIKQVADEVGCKRDTAKAARLRLHIPEQYAPSRKPPSQRRPKYTPSTLGRAPGVLGGQALELQRRKQREAQRQESRAA